MLEDETGTNALSLSPPPHQGTRSVVRGVVLVVMVLVVVVVVVVSDSLARN